MSTFQTGIQREQGVDKIVVATSGHVKIESGGLFTIPVQTLATSQVSTNVTNFGVSCLQASTTGPAYTLAAPTTVGIRKDIVMTATSSGATHRLTLYSGSSGRPILSSISASSNNTLTMATSVGPWTVSLISLGTTAWRVIGMNTVEPIGLSHNST